MQLARKHGGFGLWVAHEHNEHGGGTAHVRHALGGNESEHLGGIEPPQADMRRPHSGHTPGKTPAVTVKHGEGPEIGRAAIDPHLEHGIERIQIRAAMRIDDTFGIAGGAAGVIQADRRILVLDGFVQEHVCATGEKVS